LQSSINAAAVAFFKNYRRKVMGKKMSLHQFVADQHQHEQQVIF